MSMRRVLAVTRAQLLELSRRRGALVLLVLLPLVFYWTSGQGDYAPTFATVGVGWAFSIATLFLSTGMRPIAARLSLLGFSAGDQLVGRLLCAFGFGLVVASGLWIYIGRDDVIVNHSSLALSLLFSVIGAVASGLAVGALVPREMESMLVLIGVVGLQFVVDQRSTMAKILPLYAAERYSANASGWAPNLDQPWLPTLVVSGALLLIAILATALRSPKRAAV